MKISRNYLIFADTRWEIRLEVLKTLQATKKGNNEAHR
jgi:hypothetical protein